MLNSNLSDLQKHTLGTSVSLTSGVDYVPTSDGYFRLNTANVNGASATGRVDGNVMLQLTNATANYGSTSLFVKKGTTIKFENGSNGSGYFFPLT